MPAGNGRSPLREGSGANAVARQQAFNDFWRVLTEVPDHDFTTHPPAVVALSLEPGTKQSVQLTKEIKTRRHPVEDARVDLQAAQPLGRAREGGR